MNIEFNLKEIEDSGWAKGWHYFARGSNKEFHYEKRIEGHDFWTRKITIDFDEDKKIKKIFTYSGCPTRLIKNMQDLNYFFENNK